MRRSRALEAVGAVERRLRAEASAARCIALEAAAFLQCNRAAFARNLQFFSADTTRTAFACAAAESHRSVLSALAASLAARQRTVDDAAQAAVDAVVPWAQIRCGLERRIARRAADNAA